MLTVNSVTKVGVRQGVNVKAGKTARPANNDEIVACHIEDDVILRSNTPHKTRILKMSQAIEICKNVCGYACHEKTAHC